MNISESALIVGCGYVGRRVAATWQRLGTQVYAMTRSELKAKELSDAGIIPILHDLAQPNMPKLPDAGVVLWSVGFQPSAGTSRETIWLKGLEQLLDALPPRREARPRRILYTSSTSVYGAGNGQDIDEFTIPNPDSEGGRTCLSAEILLRHHADRNAVQLTILRLAGIYGPHRLLRRITDLQNRIPITSPPDHWLNLIHVDDAVTAIDHISHLPSPPMLINIVSGTCVTRRQYYETLATLANAPLPVFVAATEPQIPRRGGNRRVISVVRNTLNIEFQFDAASDGLRHALAIE